MQELSPNVVPGPLSPRALLFGSPSPAKSASARQEPSYGQEQHDPDADLALARLLQEQERIAWLMAAG